MGTRQRAGSTLVQADGYVELRVEAVRVVAGQPVRPLQLSLERGATLRGLVLADSGAPADARTKLRYRQPSADAGRLALSRWSPLEQGAFVIEGLSEGSVLLTVVRDGTTLLEQPARVRAGEIARLELRLPPR